MPLIVLLLYCILILAIACGLYALGAWVIAKFGVGEPARIIWLMVVLVLAILFMITLFSGGGLPHLVKG